MGFTTWMQSSPAWSIVPTSVIFGERSEKSVNGDVHLTPSQKLGVIPQDEYIEKTGTQVVKNRLGSDNMKRVVPGDFISHLRSFQGGLEHTTIPGKVSNAYTVLRPRRGIEGKYYSYLFKSASFIEGLANLTDQLRDGQTINFSRLALFSLPLPPLDTQRAIADYLDRETAEIDAMRADLDEMERLLTERRRSVVTSLTASDEWETVSLRSLAAATGGLISDGDWVELKDQDPNGEVRLLQLADVGDGCFRDKSDKWVNDNVFDLLECTALQQGDVLIARMPDPIARATLVPAFDYRSITVVDVAILRVPSSDDPAFVMHAINSAAFRSSVESKLSGSTRQRVSRSVLGREVIPRPDLPTQRRIADEIDRETAEIDSMLEDITKLRDLLAERRAAVISAAVTGQIDIPASLDDKDKSHA